MEAGQTKGIMVGIGGKVAMTFCHLVRTSSTNDAVLHCLLFPFAPHNLHFPVSEGGFPIKVNSQTVNFKRLDIF